MSYHLFAEPHQTRQFLCESEMCIIISFPIVTTVQGTSSFPKPGYSQVNWSDPARQLATSSTCTMERTRKAGNPELFLQLSEIAL